MIDSTSESLQSLKEQYDSSPYPYIPLEKSPKDEYNELFVNNLVTPYYLLHQKVIDTKDKLILDAGCGTGWKSLQLAEANPSAKIICLDLSLPSLEIAKKRLNFHGFENVEFHQLAIANIADLGYQFDYINCDEVLYFSDNPAETLSNLKSVLKPDGIIRANLHSYYQRFDFYRAQKLFQYIGLFDSNPQEVEIEATIETMQNLKDFVNLKVKTWAAIHKNNSDLKSEAVKESILMNYLIQKDKGYTISEMFEMLEKSNLQFFSMLNWRHWDLNFLFQNPDNLPFIWEMGLENASEKERLELYELLHPIHRLIDFWCIHQSASQSSIQPLSTWNEADWKMAQISLHPQLKVNKVKEDVLKSIQNQQSWEISKYISLPTLAPVVIESNMAAVLLVLWETPQTLENLTNLWLKVQPLDLETFETQTNAQARQQMIDLIIKLETFLYLLVEK